MREQILAALTQYGSPVLFGAVSIAAVGAPLPITLLLIVTGSLVAQGVMNFWWAICVASAGSILGDQIGYAAGRWGGGRLAGAITRVFGGVERLKSAEAAARKWGGPGIFFTRWLIGTLGASVNLASGIARYPWPRFLLWDVLGEVVGACLYVCLGRVFSDRIFALDALLGDFAWAVLALVIALLLGWRLRSYSRHG